MAYYKPKKQSHHISDFDKFKKICEIKKVRSPITMLFCTKDLPDEWLIDVVEYKTNSGIVSNTYMITAKDMDRHIKFIGNSGWTNIKYF